MLLVSGVTLFEMRISYIGFLLWVASSAQAQDYKTQYCEQFREQSHLITIADPQNRIAFTNSGGIFNGGVCWWHSRLQRSATYLALYRPDLPKPASSKEALHLLRKLRSLKEVVVIPGYHNFHEFTEAWRKTTQLFLNRWQLQDAVVHSAWIRGLSGSPRADAERLQRTMIALNKQVIGLKRISYLKLQLKGIVAHAWLVYSVTRTSDGLQLGIIDSNKRGPVEYVYRWGDASIKTKEYGSFMPYLEETDDFEWIDSTVSNFCS